MKSYIGEIPNIHVRDFQRQRVYNAEATCSFWQNPTTISRPKVKSFVDAIALWADIDVPKILYLSPFKNGKYLAYATPSEIILPFPQAKSIPFVCHEMAHVINYNSMNADHHGKHFVSTYLNVVKQFIGKAASIELRKSFRINHVKSARLS